MSDTTTNEPDATIEEMIDDPKVLLRQARELIPVTKWGVTPQDFAQQVDFAQSMAKVTVSLPPHLRGSVGDCLAIIDIASRAGLSPYMVANKTYVQAGRLSFESQLFHAFAQASGQLKGDLLVDYEGDGDDLVCIVSGYLRADPHVKRVHRSRRLAEAHPGHTTKDGTKFVKGSPLWDKKPRVQLFYDTSRDWVRIYCPRATLGIYTPEEMQEYGPEFARDVTPPNSAALADRLAKAAENGTGEGFHPDVVEQGLAEDIPATPSQPGRAGRRAVSRPKRTQTAAKGKNAPASPGTVVHVGSAKRVAPKAAEPTVSRETEAALRAAAAAAEPSTVGQYNTYARRWLMDCKNESEIKTRWAKERALRNRCNLTADDRAPLERMVNQRIEQLGDEDKNGHE